MRAKTMARTGCAQPLTWCVNFAIVAHGSVVRPEAPSKYRKADRAIASGERVREFQSFKEQAERRLDILETAVDRNDLKLLPSNRFEALAATARGSSAFVSTNNGVCVLSGRDQDRPFNIEICDYHS